MVEVELDSVSTGSLRFAGTPGELLHVPGNLLASECVRHCIEHWRAECRRRRIRQATLAHQLDRQLRASAVNGLGELPDSVTKVREADVALGAGTHTDGIEPRHIEVVDMTSNGVEPGHPGLRARPDVGDVLIGLLLCSPQRPQLGRMRRHHHPVSQLHRADSHRREEIRVLGHVFLTAITSTSARSRTTTRAE